MYIHIYRSSCKLLRSKWYYIDVACIKQRNSLKRKYFVSLFLMLSRLIWNFDADYYTRELDVARAGEHSVCILLHGGSIMHGGSICSLSYILFQSVVHNWSIKRCGMCCSVSGKVHIKEPLLLFRKSSLCGDSGFPLKQGWELLSLMGCIVTMDMVTGQYIDKCDCFQYVELKTNLTRGGTGGPDAT